MKTILKFTALTLVIIGLFACGKTGDLTPVKSAKINTLSFSVFVA